MNNLEASQLKTCSKCGRKRPLGRFTTNRLRPDGRYSRCRDCVSAARRKTTRTICAGCGGPLGARRRKWCAICVPSGAKGNGTAMVRAWRAAVAVLEKERPS